MKSMRAKLVRFGGMAISDAGSFSAGRIVQVTEEGRALVDWPGNPLGPVAARSIVEAPERFDSAAAEEMTVLLAFENGDPSLPIVVGVIRDTFRSSASVHPAALPFKPPEDAVLDGKTVVLDAKEEILLRCGGSSILLRKDGKIVLKGKEIVSRASGTNKIRGASVKIN